MRKGTNISKEETLSLVPCAHRVIIPLYIPNQDAYYKDSFKIFIHCLNSVRKTAISPIKISVISNGSCNPINDKLIDLYNNKHIDELIIEREGIGKINSILKALRTSEERLITISDADVLFVNGWEAAVIDVFEAFPKAGVVCPVPVFRTHSRLTSNIWSSYLFSNKLKFKPVLNPEAMTRFANSIGWPWLDEKWKDAILTLKSKNNTVAVVGSSHFVATYKSEVFSQLPVEASRYKLGGDSEYLYTDLPVLKMGGYRLSTYDNYAYHLGNTFEPWMEEKSDNIKEVLKVFNDFSNLRELKKSTIRYFFSEKIIKKVFSIKPIYRRILKYKGLNSEQVNNFV